MGGSWRRANGESLQGTLQVFCACGKVLLLDLNAGCLGVFVACVCVKITYDSCTFLCTCYSIVNFLKLFFK